MNSSGVVLYIIHSPSSTATWWDLQGLPRLPHTINKSDIHELKLSRAIKLAVRVDAQIIFEVMNERNELLARALCQRLGVSPEHVSFLYNFDIRDSQLLKDALEKFTPSPKRFILAGHYRERCCFTSVIRLRSAFPDAELFVLRGDAMASIRLSPTFEGGSLGAEKRAFKTAKTDLTVRTCAIARKAFV